MYHEAKECFLTAIEKNPEYEMAYYNAGRAFEELGDKIQAAKFYQKALELNKKTHQITTVDVQAKIFELFEDQSFEIVAINSKNSGNDVLTHSKSVIKSGCSVINPAT